MTLYFLDDVFLLNLALETAQCIFERLAFLYTNLCQNFPPPNLPRGILMILDLRNFLKLSRPVSYFGSAETTQLQGQR